MKKFEKLSYFLWIPLADQKILFYRIHCNPSDVKTALSLHKFREQLWKNELSDQKIDHYSTKIV